MNGLLELAQKAKNERDATTKQYRDAQDKLDRDAIFINLRRLGVSTGFLIEGEFARASINDFNSDRIILFVDGFAFSVPRGERARLDVRDFDPEEGCYYWRELTDITDLLEITTEEQVNATEESA